MDFLIADGKVNAFPKLLEVVYLCDSSLIARVEQPPTTTDNLDF